MKELQYQINSYIYNIRNKEQFNIEEYIIEIYQKFIEKTKNYPPLLSMDEFKIIITQIYDVLKLKLTTEEIIQSLEKYLYYLELDVNIGQMNIDSIWFINKIHYLDRNNSWSIILKMKECIPFIKVKLYNTFNKEERTKVKTMKKFSNCF